MIKHTDQRVGVFVDIQNLYHSAKHLYQARVNFRAILETAVAGRKLIRALAYVVRSQNIEEENFFEALSKQGFEVHMKDLQIFYGGVKKADWDVGLVVDAIRLSSKLDVVVLVTGDGDFLPLVEYLRNYGLIVEAVAFGRSASSKLKEEVDNFIDLCQNEGKYLLKTRIRPRKKV